MPKLSVVCVQHRIPYAMVSDCIIDYSQSNYGSTRFSILNIAD